MSFGFSVSDLLTCSKLAVDTYQALRSAPSEYRSLNLEVHSLSSTLKALKEEVDSPHSIVLSASIERRESLGVLLENLRDSLQKLQFILQKHAELGDSNRNRLKERISWSMKDTRGPRERLAVHISSLGIFLTSLTHSSLGRLEALVRKVVVGGLGFDEAISTGSSRSANRKKDEFLEKWKEMGSSVFLLGARSEDLGKFGADIEKYVLHLSRGGKPFELSVGRQLQSALPTPEPPATPRVAKDLGGRREYLSSRAEKRRRLEEYLRQTQTKEEADIEESRVRRQLERERHAAKKAYEAELEREMQEESQVAKSEAEQRTKELQKLTAAASTTNQMKKKGSKGPPLTVPRNEIDVVTVPDTVVERGKLTNYSEEIVEYSPEKATSLSPSEYAEVDALAEMFDQLFELNDKALHGQSSSSSFHTKATEFSILGQRSPNSRSPTPSQASSPSEGEASGPLEPLAPFSPDTQQDLDSPLPNSAQTFAVGPASPPPRSATFPAGGAFDTGAIFDAATKLESRLRRLSLARLNNDQDLQTDLTFYAVPDDVAHLRTFGIPVLCCDSCSLPIRELYYICEVCYSARICEACFEFYRGPSDRKGTHISIAGTRNPKHHGECQERESNLKWRRERTTVDRQYWSLWVDWPPGKDEERETKEHLTTD